MFILDSGSQRQVTGLQFSPDGRFLAVNQVNKEPVQLYSVEVWDTSTHEVVYKTRTHWNNWSNFSTDGKYFFTWVADVGYCALNLDTWQPTPLPPPNNVYQQVLLRNNLLFVVAGDYSPRTSIGAWNVENPFEPKQIWCIPTQGEDWNIHIRDVSPDGKTFVCLDFTDDYTQLLTVRNVEDGEILFRVGEFDQDYFPQNIYFHFSNEQIFVPLERELLLFPIGKNTRPIPIALPEKTKSGVFVPHPTRRCYLNAYHARRAVNVWDADSMTITRTYQWPVGRPSALAISPDGLTCAVGGVRGEIVVWDWDD